MKKQSLKKLFNDVTKNILSELTEVELQLAAMKLRKLFDQNRFPDWVLDTWVDDNKKKSVPLKNGSWLRTFYIQDSDENDMSLWYSGEVCDDHGKVIAGIKVVNINDDTEIDKNTWNDLVKFRREYKRREEQEVYNKVAIDSEIKRLEDLRQTGKATTGRLKNTGESEGGGY
jgi:hypothetical protein